MQELKGTEYWPYFMTKKSEGASIDMIGFDMGGTSTDVSRFSGDYGIIFETEIAGVSIQAPQLDI